MHYSSYLFKQLAYFHLNKFHIQVPAIDYKMNCSVRTMIHKWNIRLLYLSMLIMISVIANAEIIKPGPTALPKAKFSINDSTQCLTGNKFVFQNTSTIDAGTLTYLWNFGDAITTTLKDPIHTYLYPGVYTVKLVVTGSLGGKDSTTLIVSVYDVPKSKFILNDSSQCSKGNLFLTTNQSSSFSGDSPTYSWNFGDNKFSNLINPGHTYDSAGKYRLKSFITSKDGCTDSSFIEVVVFNTPIPSFSINDTIQPFVGNQFVFTNLTSYVGTLPKYTWKFGDDSTSILKDPIHSYKKFGTYDVVLNAKNDSTGCSDSIKISLQVLPSAKATFYVKDSILCLSGNNISLSDSSSVDAGELIYSWAFGDGDTSSQKSPTHQYRDTGTYKITLIVNGTLGGTDTAFKFVFVKPMPTARFRVDTLVQCFKRNAFSFSDSSIISQGKLTQIWLFGDNDTARSTSVVHSYESSGLYSPTLIVTSEYGCKDSSSILVEVLSEVKSIFSVNDTSQCFKGNLFKFENKSKTFTGDTEYIWSFGEDSTSSIINPDYSYSKEGKYAVNLITKHSSGCYDTTSLQLVVYPSPVVKFIINDTIQTLTDNDFVFTNLTTISSGNINHLWSFGDTTSPVDIINPRHQYDTTGTYTVTLVTTTLNGCVDSSSVGVFIFGTVKAICKVNIADQCLFGNSFEFESESSINGGNISYLWDFGDGYIFDGQYAFHKYRDPGSYKVKLIATSSAGGRDSATININVYPMPKSDFYINDSLQCITDNKFLFINRSTVPNNPDPVATWYLGDSLMSINQNVRHTYQNSGVYTVKLISSTQYGCKDSISKIVVVAPLTKGIEYDSVVTKKGYDTQLNARKFEGATYLWTPSFLINADTVINPVFNDTSNERSRQYRIRIIDQYGCIFYDTLKIFFFNNIDILAPKAFTPNGDQLNDSFRPILLGIKELKYFQIYNKWGIKIFSSTDVKTGWDGKYKGVLQPMDTYTWIVVGTDFNSKSISKTGNVLLIK